MSHPGFDGGFVVLILSVETVPRPHMNEGRRLSIDDLGYRDDGIFHVTARFGFMEQPSVLALLPLIRSAEIECNLDEDQLTYFLSTIELRRGTMPGMARWRKSLVLATSRVTADAAEYFQLPRDRTVIMGARIEV